MLVKNLEAYMIVQKVGAQESSWNKRKKVGDGQKKSWSKYVFPCKNRGKRFLTFLPKLFVPDLRSCLRSDCVDRVSVWEDCIY